MKRMPQVILALLILFTIGLPTSARGQRWNPFKRRQHATATEQSIQLTKESGPWVIMCISFEGEEGMEQARRLAVELRNQHHLKAYVYQRRFNIAKEATSHALGLELRKAPDGTTTIGRRTMKTAGEPERIETAVLVGDFAGVDDKKAQNILKQIKAMHPQTTAPNQEEGAILVKTPDGRLELRNVDKIAAAERGTEELAPMRSAFIIPNPLLPEEYFAARKTDDFIIKLNQDLPYSLLKNPGIYSVRVATFAGESTLEAKQIEKTKQHQNWLKRKRKAITSSKLADAAKKATILTRALRQQGIEAYEFHDRFESYVCVGHFDWATEDQANGGKRLNPELVATILKFKGKPVAMQGRKGAVQTYPLPQKLVKAGIALDAQPIPVLVPKAVQPVRTAKKFMGNFR